MSDLTSINREIKNLMKYEGDDPEEYHERRDAVFVHLTRLVAHDELTPTEINRVFTKMFLLLRREKKKRHAIWFS